MAKFCPFCKEECVASCGLYDVDYKKCSILILAERTDFVASNVDEVPIKLDDIARNIYEK